MAPYSERLHVMLTPEEKAMLRAIATNRGVSPSTQIRLLIREEHEALGLRKPRAST